MKQKYKITTPLNRAPRVFFDGWVVLLLILALAEPSFLQSYAICTAILWGVVYLIAFIGSLFGCD